MSSHYDEHDELEPEAVPRDMMGTEIEVDDTVEVLDYDDEFTVISYHPEADSFLIVLEDSSGARIEAMDYDCSAL